ncbi:MAG: FAD:protein transferase [Ilumatobacteraceae bacterium]
MTVDTERRFRAMGSDAHLVVVGGTDGVLDAAERRIEQLEQRWSRFIDSSEICELNRRAGQMVAVSPETVVLVQRAIEAWRLTGGGFDPTVLGAVLRAGYDVSFESMAENKAESSSDLLTGCTDIAVDGSSVRLPAGTGFDPGGIGKGLAADIVIGEIIASGAAGACVNLGGDLRVAGESPDGAAWTIAIEHPSTPEPVALIGLSEGAVATSTTLRRQWNVDGQHRHHLIDPATGEPSESDLELTTIIAGEAWIAEVLAKAVLLRGSRRAFDIVDGSGVQALTIDADGVIRITPGFQQFTGAVPLPATVNGAR